MKGKFAEEVISHIKAGHQILLVPSYEEGRVEKELARVAKNMSYEFVTWDLLSGVSSGEPIINPAEALVHIASDNFHARNAIVVFRDLHNHYNNPEVRRAIRSLSEKAALNNSRHSRPVFLVQPTRNVHSDIMRSVTTIEFQLPSAEDLEEIFKYVQKSISNEEKRSCPPDLQYKIVCALRGLTAAEAINCLSLCLVKHGGFKDNIIETIEEAKSEIIQRSEILTYIPKENIPSTSMLGGYDELIRFVKQRALAYSQKASEIDLDMPKGIVLVGIPGTGKSKAAEIIARILGLPMVVFDFSAVFHSLVGESERRTREVLNTVSAIGGCVLLIDEADKALGGSEEARDGGVFRRVFGQLLSWLAKKSDRTFVVLTMNRISGMPPELLRKGRFDEIFYVDVPSPSERRAILEIHMRARGIDPGKYSDSQWDEFIKNSSDLVGSECEEAIKSARFSAFEASHIRSLIERFESSKKAGRVDEEARKELDGYSVAEKTAALSMDRKEYGDGLKGIPSAERIIDSLREVQKTRITRLNVDDIKAIREFGSQKARSVSSASKNKETRRHVDVE